MKQILFFAFTLLVITGCSTSEDNEETVSKEKVLKSLYIVENSNSNYPIVKRTINFNYNDKVLTSIDFKNEDATTGSSIYFSYSNNLLDKVTYSSSSTNLKFNYSNGRLSTINYNKTPGYNTDGVFSLSYNGANQLNKVEYNDKNLKFTNNISYTGNEITGLNCVRVNNIQNYNRSYSLIYDDKINTYRNLPNEIKVYFSILGGDELGEFSTFNYYSYGTTLSDHNATSYKNFTIKYDYDQSNFIKRMYLTYPNGIPSTTNTTIDYTYY